MVLSCLEVEQEGGEPVLPEPREQKFLGQWRPGGAPGQRLAARAAQTRAEAGKTCPGSSVGSTDIAC